jgi:excisionase family DNA binding protein
MMGSKVSLMSRDGAVRRLLVALADAAPAFRPRPCEPGGTVLRQLLVALADASPAFTSHGTDDSSAGASIAPAQAAPPDSTEPGRDEIIRFLTVPEVASIMRVSKMTVYRMVHSGELKAIRVGRSFRVPEAAVNQYLKDSFARNRED